jgi:hypothetical protein
VKLWIWRAWSKDRKRICDCGTAWGATAADAEAVGWMTLAGPHADQVKEIEVRAVTSAVSPFGQVTAVMT